MPPIPEPVLCGISKTFDPEIVNGSDFIEALAITLVYDKQYHDVLQILQTKYGALIAQELEPLFKAIAEMEMRMRSEAGTHHQVCREASNCDLIYPLHMLRIAVENLARAPINPTGEIVSQ